MRALVFGTNGYRLIARAYAPGVYVRERVAPARNRGWRPVLACDDLPGSLVWRPIEPLQRPVHGLAMARVVRRNREWRQSRSITSPRSTVTSLR